MQRERVGAEYVWIRDFSIIIESNIVVQVSNIVASRGDRQSCIHVLEVGPNFRGLAIAPEMRQQKLGQMPGITVSKRDPTWHLCKTTT